MEIYFLMEENTIMKTKQNQIQNGLGRVRKMACCPAGWASSAHRHLFLYLPGHRLSGGCVPGRCTGAKKPGNVRGLCGIVPTIGCQADCALPVGRGAACIAQGVRGLIFQRDCAFLRWSGQKGLDCKPDTRMNRSMIF